MSINRGSFTTGDQKLVRESMVNTPKDFTNGRYINAWKYLGEISPSTLEIWLERLGADGQTIPSDQRNGTFQIPKGTAVVDCRATPRTSDDYGSQISGSFYCGGKLRQNNRDIFKDQLQSLRANGLLNHPPARLVFYDNRGKYRSPEMALRYIDEILNSKEPALQNFIHKQDVFFLDGGVQKYATDIPTSKHIKPWPGNLANGNRPSKPN